MTKVITRRVQQEVFDGDTTDSVLCQLQQKHEYAGTSETFLKCDYVLNCSDSEKEFLHIHVCEYPSTVALFKQRLHLVK